MTALDTKEAPTGTIRRPAAERATLYRWLGHVFQRECDEAVLTWHRAGPGHDFLSALATHPPFASGIEKIQTAICTTEPSQDVVLRLAGSFSTLFHGVNPSRAAPPYESHYREESGNLFGEATVRMQEILSRHGLVLMGFSEPADHIAVHLQLMAHLVELMAAQDPNSVAAKELTAAQEAFVANHLGDWVEEFGRDCVLFDRSQFYAGVAEILMAFLTEERLSIPPESSLA